MIKKCHSGSFAFCHSLRVLFANLDACYNFVRNVLLGLEDCCPSVGAINHVPTLKDYGGGLIKR